jgi:hypothetical protein
MQNAFEAANDAMSAARKTHDWALDFEPLALPPDLPPVILIVWVSLGFG